MIDQIAAIINANIPKVEASAATLSDVLSFVYGIVGVLAVVFIIVGGLRYAASGGNAASVTQAKNTITYAILGLILAILAYAITQFVVQVIDGSSWDDFRDSVINTLIFAVGIISTITIVVAGIRYVTSAGDPARIKGAKDAILYAVIGLVIAIMAYAIVNFVVGSF
jgi:quinol-cytochrome oxidoreductase complex cytochrome b subunit